MRIIAIRIIIVIIIMVIIYHLILDCWELSFIAFLCMVFLT
jgi:hypothetical protein